MKNHDIFITKHEWFRTSDDWGEVCKHCSNFVGIGTGTDGITECKERFNFEKFQNFIAFKNYSLIKNNKSKIVRYIRRFSNIIKTENQLLSEYCNSYNLSRKQRIEVTTAYKKYKHDNKRIR